MNWERLNPLFLDTVKLEIHKVIFKCLSDVNRRCIILSRFNETKAPQFSHFPCFSPAAGSMLSQQCQSKTSPCGPSNNIYIIGNASPNKTLAVAKATRNNTPTKKVRALIWLFLLSSYYDIHTWIYSITDHCYLLLLINNHYLLFFIKSLLRVLSTNQLTDFR